MEDIKDKIFEGISKLYYLLSPVYCLNQLIIGNFLIVCLVL